MLDRLRQQKSHYSVQRWKEEMEKHEQLMRKISEYPEQVGQGFSRKQSQTR